MCFCRFALLYGIYFSFVNLVDRAVVGHFKKHLGDGMREPETAGRFYGISVPGDVQEGAVENQPFFGDDAE